MRLIHIQNEVYGRPLLITRDGWGTIHRILQAKLSGDKTARLEWDDKEDDTQNVFIDKGIAYLNVSGPIGKKLSAIEKSCGVCDVDDLRDNLELAATHPDIEQIALVFDTPGGSVSGVPELAERIKVINDTTKPVTAIVDGMCCSAGYYLASGCDSIIAVGKTSYIGSIGVYSYLLDESALYAKEGVTPVLVKAGKEKGAGLPGMPITEEFKAKLQEEVDYIYQLFTEHVLSTRGNIAEETMQGSAYYTEEAVARNLIDGYVSTISEVF